MIGRYACKMLRDGGLSVTLIGLSLTDAINASWIKAAAIIGGVGAGVCAFMRAPLAINELSGFRRVRA